MMIELGRGLPRAVVALGADTKNTVCWAAGARALVSAPRADLGRGEDFADFMQQVHSWPAELGAGPEVLAYDLHPEYISRKVALQSELWPRARRVGVQHHAAHLAATAAAAGVWEMCWGLACDGTGFGPDGTLWGGEILRGSAETGFVRVARLRWIQLLGGTAAIREPWRLGLALARAAGIAWPRPTCVPEEAWRVAEALWGNAVLRPVLSSSVGRLFDGVSALLGLCWYAEREAQAAVALESCAGDTGGGAVYSLPAELTDDGLIEFDWRPMVRRMWEERCAGRDAAELAARFHDSLAARLAEFCVTAGGPRILVCGGGVFFNRRFARVVRDYAEQGGMRCLFPGALGPSDASLSLGQAVLAAFTAEEEGRGERG